MGRCCYALSMTETLDITLITEMDRGLAYGESCFETFRVINGEIFLWPEHWQRLSLGLTGFGLQLTAADEKEALSACLQHAGKVADDCLLRLTISGGTAHWGLLAKGATSCYIQALPFQPQQQPLDLQSVHFPFALNPKIAKYSADYSESLRAIQHWKKQSPDINPLACLIDKDGLILSGMTANVLLYHEQQWLTPAGDGILPGLIRRFLIQQGLVRAQPCPVTLLDSCAAMVMVNSGQFVRPVQSINGRSLHAQHPAITQLKSALAVQPGVKLESN